jgi:dolichol-phosphate mannosyltransferase
VVVPAYNEVENLPELYQQLLREFAKLNAQLELVVVDDGSADGTLDWLRAISHRDRRVKFMSFSRNFGHQAAITAGMQRATGDALIIIDADLQHPPHVLPAMLQRRGALVCEGPESQENLIPSKRLLAWGYYRLLDRQPR